MSDFDWNNAPEIVQFVRYPGTALTVAINCTVWYYIWKNGLDYAHVGSSHRLVVVEGQYWRALTASFSHISIVHLGFNMFSTWQLREVEKRIGLIEYFRCTFLFLILSIMMQQTIHFFLAKTRFGERTQNTIGVGYSCVVFAWMTFASLLTTSSSLNLIFFRLPYNVSPFFSLILTQVVIPNVDFVGHLAGIIAGYIVGWGLVGWLRQYWLLQCAAWFFALCLASLVRTGIPVPYVKEEPLTDSEAAELAAFSADRPRDPWAPPPPARASPIASGALV
mmetsp:Transcript_78340/g.210767  ORF Transcript_78340/g.210767 Transcript_78340/m.210767 type:complete len:278 (-) Transcript_78340:14-847(-)